MEVIKDKGNVINKTHKIGRRNSHKHGYINCKYVKFLHHKADSRLRKRAMRNEKQFRTKGNRG